MFEKRFKEIILYRKQDLKTVSTIQNIFCPINGRYHFTYTAKNGEFQCPHLFSEISNCPHGNSLGIRFRQCNFPDMNVQFLCLGDWEGPNEDRHLALMDLRPEPEGRPKYRCGLYKKDEETGVVFISLSADSTCSTRLRSSSEGYESLLLSPFPESKALLVRPHCKFPDWSQGQWEHILVDGRRFTFRDFVNFQTITATCIQKENKTPNDRFFVSTVSQW
ncbi:uncharacterized protein LOC143233829 [Tachypleus tridentatus]|uniref:uncharacterized protein LOC143233829 n=1 Tax=Tachypleus tridentatus TaxID=6853 RepID=UPI003FD5DFCE